MRRYTLVCLAIILLASLASCTSSPSSSTTRDAKLLDSLESANKVSQQTTFSAWYKHVTSVSSATSLYAQRPPMYVWRIEGLARGSSEIYLTDHGRLYVCSSGIVNRCLSGSTQVEAQRSFYSPVAAYNAMEMIQTAIKSRRHVTISSRRIAGTSATCFTASFIVQSKSQVTTDCFTRQGIFAMSRSGRVFGFELTRYSSTVPSSYFVP